MKIKHWMTPDPITVTPDTLIIDAKKIMKEKHIRRLPVVQDGNLVGIVTYRNIIEASPSAATSLSIHELNYLILKLKVADVMRRNPITVGPEDSVLDVVLQGHQRGIGAFPVVDGNKLVGIVTETEIVKVLIQIFGTRAKSEIIHIENVDPEASVGQFASIAKIVEDQGVALLGMFTIPHRDTGGYHIYLRVKTKEPQTVVSALGAAGYKTGN